MNPFDRDVTYDDNHKIVQYPSTFNSSSKLEFNLLTRVSKLVICIYRGIPFF